MQLQTAVHNRSPGKLALLTECSDGERAPDDRDSFAGFMDPVCVGPLRERTSGTVHGGWRWIARGPHRGGGSQRRFRDSGGRRGHGRNRHHA